MLTSFYELCVAYINPKWWSCRPKIIWIVSDDLVGTLMGHIFLQNTWLRALLRLVRCTAGNNKGLSCWPRLHLLRLLTGDIWRGAILKEAFLIIITLNTYSCCFGSPWKWYVELCAVPPRIWKCLCPTFSATSPLSVRARPIPSTQAEARKLALLWLT